MAAPHSCDHLFELFQRQRRAKARNGFQLVQRSTGVSQRPPADHRHGHAARRCQRRNQKTRLVAHAACRVLVHRLLAQPRRRKLFARVAHRQRQRAHLAQRKPPQPSRHQPRRKLLQRNRSRRRARRHKTDLPLIQRAPVPFLQDQVNHVQRSGRRRAS